MAENNHPLAKWRDSQNPRVTQEAFAAEMGVWPLTVWRWEHGERTPRPRVARRISDRTGIPVGDLIEAGSD